MDKIVRFIKLPTTVRGITIPDQDGNYNIYINSNLSREMQLETFRHELLHVENGDFYSDKPVAYLEARVNRVMGRR